MKKLRKVLEEAISTSALDNRLNPLRQAAKPGMRGATGEYVDALELALDWVSNRTTASDKDFDAFMEKTGYGEPSSSGSPGPSQELSPPSSKRKKAKDVEAQPEKPAEKEPEKKSEPVKSTSSGPPPLPKLGAVAKDKSAEPAKKEPEKPLNDKEKQWRDKVAKEKGTTDTSSVPDLKSLVSKETGSEVPERPTVAGMPDLPAFYKNDIEKDAEKEKQQRKAKKSKKGEEPTSDLPSLKSIGKETPERMGIGVNPETINTQNWKTGEKVKIGFVKTPFTVLGGNAGTGWFLKDPYGKRYIFYPSRHPKLGRGLYRMGRQK